MPDPKLSEGASLLASAALAWDALRSHAGVAEGSPESCQLAKEVMGILLGADVRRLERRLDALAGDRAERERRNAEYERYAYSKPGIRP